MLLQVTKSTVHTALGIVHNCAQVEANCVLLRKYGFVEGAQPYTDISSNSQTIVMNAAMAISYVMEENEGSMARLDKGMEDNIIATQQS